jgi:hypothetical protein
MGWIPSLRKKVFQINQTKQCKVNGWCSHKCVRTTSSDGYRHIRQNDKSKSSPFSIIPVVGWYTVPAWMWSVLWTLTWDDRRMDMKHWWNSEWLQDEYARRKIGHSAVLFTINSTKLALALNTELWDSKRGCKSSGCVCECLCVCVCVYVCVCVML